MQDRRGGRAIGVAIGLLVCANIASNRVLPSWATVPVNAGVAVALLAVAAWSGLTATDLGLDRAALRRGWQVGRWLALGVLIVLAAGLALPATRSWFEDERVRSLGWVEVAYHALVAVPLGTVLLEEVAFRGVLPEWFARLRPRRFANLTASLLFGVWHVLPAWEIYRVNPALRGVLHGVAGRAVAVAFAVVSTAVIGLAWCWLRDRSRSLLTTMLAHTAGNSLGYVFAFVAWSLS